MPIPKVRDISPNMGCDPEFFFTLNGEPIGAEKILPKNGLQATGGSKFIIDGVQAELNPRPNTCRGLLGNEIKACFITLKAELGKHGKGYKADFSRAVEISKKNLMELDESSRKFGCTPSKSIYKKTAGLNIKKIDPEKYLTRAAGGHIHIGMGATLVYNFDTGKNQPSGLYTIIKEQPEKVVMMLDILCGNTAVLVDRDKSNIERRKLYGKAGEFRLPPHGLEYRTLSNFWLTSAQLMSFAFGQARLAVQLMADKNHETFFKEFTSKIKYKNIKDAINNNDYDLAMENFKAIEPLMLEVHPVSGSGRYPINSLNIKEFYYFANTVNKKGLAHFFPKDPMDHWTTEVTDAHSFGFSDYLCNKVRLEMNTPPLINAVKKAVGYV